MSIMRTIRIATITHAQAIRLPGHELNSVQIDGVDHDGSPVRVILEPQVLAEMRQNNTLGSERSRE